MITCSFPSLSFFSFQVLLDKSKAGNDNTVSISQTLSFYISISVCQGHNEQHFRYFRATTTRTRKYIEMYESEYENEYSYCANDSFEVKLLMRQHLLCRQPAKRMYTSEGEYTHTLAVNKMPKWIVCPLESLWLVIGQAQNAKGSFWPFLLSCSQLKSCHWNLSWI